MNAYKELKEPTEEESKQVLYSIDKLMTRLERLSKNLPSDDKTLVEMQDIVTDMCRTLGYVLDNTIITLKKMADKNSIFAKTFLPEMQFRNALQDYRRCQMNLKTKPSDKTLVKFQQARSQGALKIMDEAFRNKDLPLDIKVGLGDLRSMSMAALTSTATKSSTMQIEKNETTKSKPWKWF